MADIGAVFSGMKTNIRSAKMVVDQKKRLAHLVLQIDTTGVNDLQEMISRVNVLSDIIQIHRKRAGA